MKGKGMRYDSQAKTITISQNTGITVSVTLILMFAGAVFTIATWAADMRNRVTIVENAQTTMQSELVKLQAQDTASQVKFVEIQTQLKSIDANLLEIKERLR